MYLVVFNSDKTDKMRPGRHNGWRQASWIVCGSRRFELVPALGNSRALYVFGKAEANKTPDKSRSSDSGPAFPKSVFVPQSHMVPRVPQACHLESFAKVSSTFETGSEDVVRSYLL